MNLSAKAHLHVVDSPMRGISPAAGSLLNRGVLRGDGSEALPDGDEPALADRELFRMLLADDGGNDSSADHDDKDNDQRREQSAHRTERRDDIARVGSRHDSAARRGDNPQDPAAIGALDLAAVSAVVTRVYLENHQERERAVHMALDDDLLPATRLSVFERGGRLAVDFISMNVATRERLRRGAPALADRVAGDLRRDVSVKVGSHDGDRLALEVCADAASISPARKSL